jgi:PAS domain S-box-containing protein
MDESDRDDDPSVTGSDLSEFLQRRTAHVDEILDTMADVVLQLDETGTVQYTNDAVESVLGFEGDALVGNSIDYVFADPAANESLSDALSSGAFVDRLLAEREVTDMDAVFRTADGHAVPMSLSASVLGADGGVDGIVCVAKDISERREARDRTEFLLSLLRHDVQNKLHLADSYLDLLLEDATLDADERTYVERAREGVGDAESLINRVDAMHRLDEEIETARLRLADIVDEAVKRHDALREKAGTAVEATVDERIHVTGNALLTELFANLVENAVRHSQGDRVEISAERRDGEVAVRVDDDGVGIPAEDRESVFERGFSTRDEDGSGRGMALVQQIAESCGGSVTATESPLGGARIVVTLPA